MSFHVPHAHRIRTGRMASDNDAGNNGAFWLPRRPGEPPFFAIASDGVGWEHVSVSLPNRCLTWPEMSAVKAMFWDAEDCVVQYHPPASSYVNNHPHCLHLWRPTRAVLPMPDDLLVGIKSLTPDQMARMKRSDLLDLQQSISVVVEERDATS